jgi:hypothetical protein
MPGLRLFATVTDRILFVSRPFFEVVEARRVEPSSREMKA